MDKGTELHFKFLHWNACKLQLRELNALQDAITKQTSVKTERQA